MLLLLFGLSASFRFLAKNGKKNTNWDLQQVGDKKWYFGGNAAAAVSKLNQPRRKENDTQSISFCLQTGLIIYPKSTWK